MKSFIGVIALFLVLITHSSTGFSDVLGSGLSLAGVWTGTGTSISDFSRKDCQTIELEIQMDSKFFRVARLRLRCGTYFYDKENLLYLSIQDGKLVSGEGKILGTIDESSAHLKIVDGTYAVKYEIRLQKGQLEFKQHEVWGQGHFQIIQGQLSL